MDELRQAEARVEELIAQLSTAPRVGEQAEELVRLLMRLYGEGLARVVALLPAEAVRTLAADDLVGSLLILHDLHPRGTAERVADALVQLRPFLGTHTDSIELAGIDASGRATVRLRGGCGSCASGTVEQAVERAVRAAAPEVTGVRLEQLPPQRPLLQIGSRPPADAPAAPAPGARP
ncbi:NifU family protein [Streptomyces ochraceiscleroticus]|uniref:NifU family protein n=1 Tax=Streptomyces ochraceiscleroticus TaxID=47761 RepID=A0ABW1MI97_9ACTN|nr:NifU family protein [Streptomyces ochraceiscleroticus]